MPKCVYYNRNIETTLSPDVSLEDPRYMQHYIIFTVKKPNNRHVEDLYIHKSCFFGALGEKESK
ncbi:MAG: hypothetical protein ACFFCW_14130 [Candidatus Hodarchaeota archaeon]